MIPRNLTVKDLGGSILAVSNARNIHRQLTEIALYGKIGGKEIPQSEFGIKGQEAPRSNIGGYHVAAPDVQITSRRGQAHVPANPTGAA